MRYTSQNGGRREPEAFTPDTRPGADSFVYCKGCGKPLEGQARHQQPKAVVTVMMCAECQEFHGHALIPKSGSPTFCYRCGGPDEIFEAPGTSPAIYHVCPRCLPERAARYRVGNFDAPQPQPQPAPAPATAEK